MIINPKFISYNNSLWNGFCRWWIIHVRVLSRSHSYCWMISLSVNLFMRGEVVSVTDFLNSIRKIDRKMICFFVIEMFVDDKWLGFDFFIKWLIFWRVSWGGIRLCLLSFILLQGFFLLYFIYSQNLWWYLMTFIMFLVEYEFFVPFYFRLTKIV